METTLEKLQVILMKDYQLPQEALTRDAPLESLGIDSLGTAELLFNIEDHFHVVVPPEAVTLSTLGDVVDYIDNLIELQSLMPQQAGVQPA
jgi:acyl carrier protein